MTQAVSIEDRGIVASETFILATRDAGYRNVAAAVAELIDNSIQANARHVHVVVRDDDLGSGRSVTIGVLDDGCGMSADTLQAALQFGGSNRFGERTGLGRFGMGLPNSSVSQTRRFEVYSWQRSGPVQKSYLDVDEVASGQLRSIPAPVEAELPAWISRTSFSGTLIVWTRCDRLSRLKATTVAQRLREVLGRLYRFILWEGVRISVNDVRLAPVDPLFIHETSPLNGATPFGSPLVYEFNAPTGGTANVEVRFSELPVAAWENWSTEEKRRRGIIGRAGVSIVRAGREIDYGWYLMGGKRRENYDDWWRCEVRFSPKLDELFGVTHSKQGITPSIELKAAIESDLEAVARTLNSRVRSAFENARRGANYASREASERDQYLPVPPRVKHRLAGNGLRYRIEDAAIDGPEFYRARLVADTVVVTLNRNHPFFTQVYAPAKESDSPERHHVECLILAAARADLEAGDPAQRSFLDHVRRSWADALATFLER